MQLKRWHITVSNLDILLVSAKKDTMFYGPYAHQQQRNSRREVLKAKFKPGG